MKRPFFFLAIFSSILILIFNYFLKEDRFSLGHISNFVLKCPRRLAMKGRVISDPFYKDTYFKKTQIFIVSPTLVKASKIWFPASGNIYVKSSSKKELKYGDEILFEANLKIPYSGEKEPFDYKKYLERAGIYAIATISERDPLIIIGKKASTLRILAYNLKDIISRSIKHLFKAPERYFLSAILVGERQYIPKEWQDIFMKTQTMHLLAISGLHVWMIAFIILFLVGLFGTSRNFRYIISILLLAFYALMVGGMPSVVRATVMGIVILSSYLLKRNTDIYNSLGLAAIVILMYNPNQLFTYSFILSFGSVLSIIYIMPHINHMLRFDRIKRITYRGNVIYYFLTLASTSLAVWLGLLPLNVNFFNIISPVSILVNMLAIPLFFVILSLSISALIFQIISPFLGAIFARATELFIAVLLLSSRLFLKLPFAYFEVKEWDLITQFLYYIILIMLLESKRLKQAHVEGKR
jgi:competence protein ComEC